MSGTYHHPVDDIEPEEPAPSVAAKVAALDMFKELLQRCLPPRGYGEVRRFEAGYRRLVVFTYVHAPEFFNGMNKRELAAQLGITYRALMLEFDHARTILRTTRPNVSTGSGQASGVVVKHATNLRQILPGPPRVPPPAEVPRDAERSRDGII